MWRHKNCAITPPPGENLCSQKVLRSGTIANLPLTTCHPSSFSFLNLRASLSNVSSQRMMLQCSNGWKYCKSDFVLLSLFSIKSCIIKDLVPNRVKMLCASDKVKGGQWKTRTRIVWKLDLVLERSARWSCSMFCVLCTVGEVAWDWD